MEQGLLFDDPALLPAGLTYQRDFLSCAEEQQMMALFRELPFEAARYKGYVARHSVVSYGGSFETTRTDCGRLSG